MFTPESEGLFTPSPEGDGVDDGGLLDLAAGEDAPSDGHRLKLLDVGAVERRVVVDHLQR